MFMCICLLFSYEFVIAVQHMGQYTVHKKHNLGIFDKAVFHWSKSSIYYTASAVLNISSLTSPHHTY